MAGIKSSGAEAILVLNRKNYWNTFSYTVNYNTVSTNEKPNAMFIGYLINSENNHVVWASKSVIKAFTIAGYDMLNNKLANRLSSFLMRENYIYTK